MCDTFLTFPPKHRGEYSHDIRMKLPEQLFEDKTTEEIENNMKAILSMFYRSVKLKYLHENCDIFRNIANIFSMIYAWT